MDTDGAFISQQESSDDPLARLIETYHDLNASLIDELDEEPSPLEFMRYVAKNRPFIVRQSATGQALCQKWNSIYFLEVIGDDLVDVAITPYGNADSLVDDGNGSLVFVKPYVIQQPFRDFLEDVSTRNDVTVNDKPVKYAQTQNDNLRGEYAMLFRDVPKDIPFARIALQQGADAINLWLGNSRSVTALHKDNYENIYVQIGGQKNFVLLPPVDMPCVNEQEVPGATYKPCTKDRIVTRASDLEVSMDEPPETVPVATWDPDRSKERPSAYSHIARPMRVTLNPGDMLYLPAMWFHKVNQTSNEEGIAYAINYWYDMEFSGGFWATHSFIREVSNSQH